MRQDTTDRFLSVIRQLIQESSDASDQTAVCRIAAKNADGTYDIYILPDETTKVTGIINATPYEYSNGDMAYLYKVKNQIASSFLIGGTKVALAKDKGTAQNPATAAIYSSGSTSTGSGGVTSTTFVQTASGPTIETSINGKVQTVTVDNVATANYSSYSNLAANAKSADVATWAVTANAANYATYAPGDSLPISETYLNVSTTTNQPEAVAETSYSITTLITEGSSSLGSEIPTAQAVADFASSGKSVLVTNKTDATDYYLVGTNVSSGQASMSVNTNIWYQPSTGTVHAATFDGNAVTATTASNYFTSAGASANIAATFASKQDTIPVIEVTYSTSTIYVTDAQLSLMASNDLVLFKGLIGVSSFYSWKNLEDDDEIGFSASQQPNGVTTLYQIVVSKSTKIVSLFTRNVPLELQNNSTLTALGLTALDLGLYDGDTLYGNVTIDFKTVNNIPVLGSGNIQLQTPLTFDTTPTANSANPVTSGGIYGYAVSDVGWDAAQSALTVVKGGVSACIATSQPEQVATDSYSITSNIDTASSPATAIPTAQAVKDYVPVNAGEGISVANKTISLNVATADSLGGIKVGYSGTADRTYAVTLDATNHAYVSVPWASTNWRPVYLNGSQILSNSTSSGNLGFLNGQAISLTNSGGNVTIGANLATATTAGIIKPGSSLTVSAGTLDVNLGHTNNWTAPQYFGSDVAIAGNLVVTGNTTYANVHSLNVDNALITLANSSEYARPLTVGVGLYVANCAGTTTNSNVALVFDQNGIAYVGRANLNSAGNIIVAENPGLIPLMGRDAQRNFSDGDLISWDASGKKSVDSGAKVATEVSDSDSTVPTGGAVYDYAVANVAWNASQTELQVTKGATVSCIASAQPEQAAQSSYSIISNLETNQGVDEVPTAQAVANYAASARTGSVSFSPDGTYNTTGAFASATYLVKTGVGYINGGFTAASAIARGSMGAVSAATDLTAWLGSVTANFIGVGTDMTSNNDMSFRLAVSNGSGTLYASAVPSGHSVRFKIYC